MLNQLEERVVNEYLTVSFYSHDELEGYHIVKLSGALDIGSSKSCSAVINAKGHPAKGTVFLLDDLKLLTTGGLEMFLQTIKEHTARNRRVVFIGLQGQPHERLSACRGLLSMCEEFQDLDEFVSKVKEEAPDASRGG
jgi:anti-anti-sigma regulatory factor